MFVYLINKKEIDTFVLPGCERHVKAWLGGLKPRYPKQNHDCEYKVDKLRKQDQTGLDRSARSTLDFGANTVERYT